MLIIACIYCVWGTIIKYMHILSLFHSLVQSFDPEHDPEMFRRGSASLAGFYSLNSSVSQQLLSINIQAKEGETCKPACPPWLHVRVCVSIARGLRWFKGKREGGRERERERQAWHNNVHVYCTNRCTCVLHVCPQMEWHDFYGFFVCLVTVVLQLRPPVFGQYCGSIMAMWGYRVVLLGASLYS